MPLSKSTFKTWRPISVDPIHIKSIGDTASTALRIGWLKPVCQLVAEMLKRGPRIIITAFTRKQQALQHIAESCPRKA